MKYLIATDLHGSAYWAKRVIERFDAEGADKLVLLGDLYYHGPRNPLPKDYAPMEVAGLFNLYKDKIIAVRGNCDADIDQTISEFKLNKNVKIKIGGHSVFFTHGDKYDKNNLPALKEGDVLLYGHWHQNEYAKVGGVNCVNLASASLPKNGAEPSYAVLDERGLTVKTFEGKAVVDILF